MTGGSEVDVSLHVPGEERVPEGKLRDALARLFSREGKVDGELSITFLADEPIRELNRRYLEHDWVPDVLAFSFDPPLIGDVYVGIEQAARQAAEYRIPFEEECVRLALHGTLHLLGYDHPEDAEGREGCEQTRIQEEIVREVFG